LKKLDTNFSILATVPGLEKNSEKMPHYLYHIELSRHSRIILPERKTS
jgi:hypothetical protein